MSTGVVVGGGLHGKYGRPCHLQRLWRFIMGSKIVTAGRLPLGSAPRHGIDLSSSGHSQPRCRCQSTTFERPLPNDPGTQPEEKKDTAPAPMGNR